MPYEHCIAAYPLAVLATVRTRGPVLTLCVRSATSFVTGRHPSTHTAIAEGGWYGSRSARAPHSSAGGLGGHQAAESPIRGLLRCPLRCRCPGRAVHCGRGLGWWTPRIQLGT